MKYEKNKLYKDSRGNLVQFLSQGTMINFHYEEVFFKRLSDNTIWSGDINKTILYELTDEDKAELL